MASNGLAALAPNTGVVASWAPALSSGAVVNAIAVGALGSDVYVGGTFTSPETDAAEFNSISAVAQPWNPGITSGSVNAIAPSAAAGPAAIYLGGSFASAAGSNMIAVDPSSGAAIAGFAANVNGPVYSLATSSDGTTVFLGGNFTMAGLKIRSDLAGLFTSNGTGTTFSTPAPDGPVYARSH